MSDEEETSADAKEAPSGKSSKGLVVVVLLAAVVLGGGAAAAGAVVAMKVATPATAATAPAPSATEEKILGTVDFASIVVDIHGQDGAAHHLRVSLSAEIPAETPKEEAQALTPRGRQAAIAYLRSLTYEEATAPGSFDKIRTELNKRMVEAVGEKRIGAVILTDFVLQ